MAALQYLQEQGEGFTVNLGIGVGYSVLDVVRAFEAASGQQVPCKISPDVRVTWPSAVQTPA